MIIHVLLMVLLITLYGVVNDPVESVVTGDADSFQYDAAADVACIMI